MQKKMREIFLYNFSIVTSALNILSCFLAFFVEKKCMFVIYVFILMLLFLKWRTRENTNNLLTQ